MNKFFITFILLVISTTLMAQDIIKVPCKDGDITKDLQAAIESARKYKGRPVVIELQNADYNISRNESSGIIYHISNTTSEAENPDQTKHIGLWIKDMKNLTIDGRGAKFITHGEMTSFVIDNCENITLKNFTVSAADPTVPELTVESVLDNAMIVNIHPQSKYKIEDNKFFFVGHSWQLSDGIAQCYDREKEITWRSWSPLSGLQKAFELKKGKLCFIYNETPKTEPGLVYQMRDAIRDEACGLISRSKNTLIENVNFEFLGNFGIVAQVSDGITYRDLVFAPEEGSGRTCAGFADFVQVSGCKGKVLIERSRFSGAHDDPINVHGTHLKVVEFISDDKMVLEYKHGQSYGFQSFNVGDEIDFINENSLMPVLSSAKVKTAVMDGDRRIVVTLDRSLSTEVRNRKDLVVENATYTPEVYIRNNHFSRIPSRGVLVTTRGKVIIEDNVFFRMQMSGIFIADDARSWYESGMVRDVTIRNNNFIECGEPVIFIAPENSVNDGYVHRNINIVSNRFKLNDGVAVSAKSVNGLIVRDNVFESAKSLNMESIVQTTDCKGVVVEDNILYK